MSRKIIEKLKKNEKPFALLEIEMQKAIKEIPARYFDCLTIESVADNPIWNQCKDGSIDFEDGEDMIAIFKLRANYQPEPEIIECPLCLCGQTLRFFYKERTYDLCQCLNRPDFYGFKWSDGTITLAARKFGSSEVCPFRRTINGKLEYPTHVLMRESEDK